MAALLQEDDCGITDDFEETVYIRVRDETGDLRIRCLVLTGRKLGVVELGALDRDGMPVQVNFAAGRDIEGADFHIRDEDDDESKLSLF